MKSIFEYNQYLNEGKVDKLVKNWLEMDIENVGNEEYDIIEFVKKGGKIDDVYKALSKQTKGMDPNEKGEWNSAMAILLSEIDESLHENKKKKIKELKAEIKSLKDENEEGYETEIKELEFELSQLEEKEVYEHDKGETGTIKISKSDMEKIHKDGEVSIDLDGATYILKMDESLNEGEKITDFYTALGTIVSQVAKHPKLAKYYHKGKSAQYSYIKLQDIKDLGEKKIIELANSL